MVDEIRSYLLNSPKYSKWTYFPKEYSPQVLGATMSRLRSALIGDDAITDPEEQVWRGNVIVSGIYENRYLNKVANELFDTRRTALKESTITSFTPQIYISSTNPNVVFAGERVPASITSSINKTITITRAGSNTLGVSVQTALGETKTMVGVSFSGVMSTLVQIPETSLKIGFKGVGSIPEDFQPITIQIKYLPFMAFSSVVANVMSIPQIDFLLLGNKVAGANLTDMYSTSRRANDRVLCLALAFAINLKFPS